MKISPSVKNWHVVYTRSRSEKKVYEELQLMGIESFLPLQKKLHKWKDRKKWVETPLFNGYCFVKVDRKEYDKVLQNNNVVCYITFGGRAAILSESQIRSIQTVVKQSEFDYIVSNESFVAGKEVEIIEGPLIGLKGNLVRSEGKNKFIIKIEQLNNSIMIEVSKKLLTYLS